MTTLMEELREQNTFETEEESRRREIVLGRVAALVRKYDRDVSISKGLSDTAANAASGKIFTFGSYRLGVFEPMVRVTEGASEVSGIPGASVPVIRAKISDVSLDLLIAPIGMSAIPEDLSLKDKNVLKNLDETIVRSVNGTRLTDELLRLVPNVPVFRDALRCVKLWAQRKAIYSNVNGYLGGVPWGMPVARICQLYPNAAAGAIVSRFFTIMSKWQWSQPVLLNQIEDGPLQVRVWNPKAMLGSHYPSDRAHRMPSITPNYPSMSHLSIHDNVSASILSEQIQNGADTVDKAIAGTASWAGTVESRMRHLIMKVQFVDNLALAHPFIKGLDCVVRCASEEEAAGVLLGQAPRRQMRKGPRAGTPTTPPNAPPRRLDVSFSITEFVTLVKAGSFDPATTGIALKHIRSCAPSLATPSPASIHTHIDP
ncbi:Poly(A) polymerase central domain-containing protein [Mycena latifolia]|nr:Poly(A) polymerase central domain-containing protein [Mycena latifolia]